MLSKVHLHTLLDGFCGLTSSSSLQVEGMVGTSWHPYCMNSQSALLLYHWSVFLQVQHWYCNPSITRCWPLFHQLLWNFCSSSSSAQSLFFTSLYRSIMRYMQVCKFVQGISFNSVRINYVPKGCHKLWCRITVWSLNASRFKIFP